MAARRLLILMLVLLGVSTLAAALVPTPGREDEGEETEATTAPATTEAAPAKARKGDGPAPEGGRHLQARIEVGGEKIPVVPVAVGDQLTLEIRSKHRGLLEIPALGRVEAVSPGTSAFFYLLARERVSYGIRFVGAEKVVARIEVEPASRPRARAE